MPRRIGPTVPFLLALLFLAAGCAPREQREQVYAMSTLVEVSVVGRSAAEARGDLAAVERELRRVERTFRAWDEGQLADANRALAATAQRVLARIEVAGDACVFTSGDYERAFLHDGVRHHHILDPRSGAPARGAAAVTVVLERRACAGADAAAIAVMIAGPAALEAVAQRFGLAGAAAITEDGVVHATATLAPRLAPMVDGLRLVVAPAPGAPDGR